MNSKTIKSFVRQFIAAVKGESDEVQAEKVFRQAQSAFATTIAARTGDTIQLEDDVQAAQEQLELCRVNEGKLITDRTVYIKNLIVAKNNLIRAEEALKDHEADLEFLISEKRKLEKEESVEE